MTESREVLWFTLFCTGTAAAPRDFNALSAFQGKRKKCVTFLRQGDNVPTFRNGSVGKDMNLTQFYLILLSVIRKEIHLT